jgi:putative holin Dp-1
MNAGRLYDFLKFLALVVLPGAGALYFTVGSIWGLPAVEQVVGTISAVDLFLGDIVRRMSKEYQKAQPPLEMHGSLIIGQYPNGEVGGMRMTSEKHNPVFAEGTVAGFVVKREKIPEPDFTQE